ncbi:hypothetical protein DFJ58DRAFT_678728, partial [Suillus subalutaceus]|uniref:uncharacterized protein n=1 Tax=Suillus subalutaceus TaxID=48586 RepID=UPI001B882C81
MQTSNSNIDSPPVSPTIGEMQKPLDAIMCKESDHDTVRNGVSYRQRQLVEEKANIIQSNISPRQFSSAIWRLPTEILSQIFLYCLPEDKEFPSPIRSQAPLLLTGICRRWREVAVDLPSLWCTLQLTADNHWYRRARFYDSWLKRSAGRPLSLTL